MIVLLNRPSVRKETAKTVAVVDACPQATENKFLPTYITPITAMSRASDVRLALAGRLVTLLPRLPEDKQSQLYAYTVQALGSIALEEVLKIRLALSATLKDHAFIPPKLATEIARLVERDVSEPVLRFCAGVSDEDLVAILRAHPAPWAERVVIEQGVKSLAAPETLQSIVLKSRALRENPVPLPTNLALPPSLVRELSEFVDAAVREVLMRQGNFDSSMTEEITSVFRRRLDRLQENASADVADDESLIDALALRKTERVFEGLAQLLKVNKDIVVEIFESRSAKSIVALCWKAGLSMRTALTLQRDLGLVSTSRLIYPKGGTDYPLTESEILWQLEFLDLNKS